MVLEGVLSPAEVASLNATFDHHVATLPSTTLQTMLNDEDPPGCYPNGRGRRFWSPDYMRLVAHPAVEPLVGELLSDPVFGFALPETPVEKLCAYRMDHDNIHFTRPYDPAGPPRSGSAASKSTRAIDHGGGQWTTHGIVRGGLHGRCTGHHVTAVFELCDVPAGQGGFGYCARSHLPGHWASLRRDGKDQHGNALQSSPPWPESYEIKAVPCRAGSCILFSEKLWHTTTPWTAASERRTLFYKYIPWGLHSKAPRTPGQTTRAFFLAYVSLPPLSRH